uniref:DNA replication licensing factor MCM4 n=1 Tax=Cacopsylla melanoneura TaxID=428564 RepID=A0A8D9AE93_9HEMI
MSDNSPPPPSTPSTPRTRSRSAQNTPVRTPSQPEDDGSTRETPRSRGTTPQVATRRTPSSQGTPTTLATPQRPATVPGGLEVIEESPGTPSSRRTAAQSPFTDRMSEIDLASPLNYGTPSSIGSLRTPRSGIQGTPIRLRPDIRTDRRIRQVSVGPAGSTGGQTPGRPDQSPHPGAEGSALVIWGTDVVVDRCKAKFKTFLETFVQTSMDEDERIEGLDESQPLYMQKIDEIFSLEEPVLNVNLSHLKEFDAQLCQQLVCYPQEVIPILDMGVNEYFFERHPAAVLEHQIQVRPFNAKKTRNLRHLNPEDIDQLITINGMVIRTSNIIPEMREAFFRCIVCNFSTTVEIDRGRIHEPTLCTNCSTNHCFSLVHNRSHFTDKQLVRLQETPDDMPAGQTPHSVVLFTYNDLVDSIQPGDRITVTGIYRAVPLQLNPRMRSVKSVYKTHIDVVHFRKIDTTRLYKHDEKEHKFPPERIELLKSLSQKPDIYERLTAAVCPSIYGHEDVKKGILLQMFGGTKKTFVSSGRDNFRAEINILLCGDPGTSKSQLLSYVYDVVPRSQYTSGKGSSAVGLTAYITKDPETRQMVLQTGALVLADSGVCCIDEFDKMSDATRSILHEVMEQQTLSIAKAGIICQLNARTSILAAANPCDSQWNTSKTIIDNIRLPHTLLSRFDLIFLMLDPQSEQFDARLARHLVSLYSNETSVEDSNTMDISLLRDYIAFAQEHLSPTLGEEASQRLIQTYVDMRKLGAGRGRISAYPRQLESLIRLSEAHAKMRYSDTVEVEDVEEAWRLHREALKQSATDPLSGKIDVSIITTGVSSAARQRQIELTAALKKLVIMLGPSVTVTQQKLMMDLKTTSQLMVSREMFEDALKQLQDDGVLQIPSKTTVVTASLN